MTVTTVSGSDFGLAPDREENSAPALQAALVHCRASGASRLVLEPGRYQLWGGETQGDIGAPCVVAEETRDLEIEGQGAELVGRDLSTLFHFHRGRNLTIRNLTIDWHPLPFTGGVAVATGETHFDMKVVPPHPALAGVVIQGVLGYDPANGRMAHRGLDFYQRSGECLTPTEVVGDGIVRVFVRHPRGVPSIGDPVIARHQIYSCNPFHFSACTDVELSGITIYSAPGMGLVGSDSENFALRDFNVLVRPKSDRWMSTGADATHFISCRGAISIENCLFEAMGDDATNIHNRNLLVTGRSDGHTLRLTSVTQGSQKLPEHPPRPGDIMEIGGGENPLSPYAALTVAAVTLDAEAGEVSVTFEQALPEQTGANDVAANASAAPSARIRNCTVRNNRARGMLIQTRDVIVEDCVFEHVSGAAIHIASDANFWWEGMGARDVLVRRNRFLHCNFGAARRAAVVDLFSELEGNTLSPAGVHRNIVIEGNRFDGADGSAIHMHSADGVTVRGNEFIDCQDVAIQVSRSRNVTIVGNTLAGDHGGLSRGPDLDEQTTRVSDNTGF